MEKTILNEFGKNGDMLFPDAAIGFLWCPLGDERYQSGSFFASVGQMGFRVSKNPLNSGSITLANLMGKYMMPEPSVQMDSGEIELKFSNSSRGIMAKNLLPESGIQMGSMAKLLGGEEWVLKEEKEVKNEKKKGGMKLKVKIGNPSLRRLVSGAIAGAISRTVVAPLETIRTHLMVGSCGHSSTEVFQNIIKDEGWQGLFKGNLVNVIRVAPSKAIELFAYDTVKKQLTPKPGEQPNLFLPAAPIAGAVAGISSTLCTYPLELLKTRITVQRGVYKNLLDAFMKIVKEEGPAELYRGLIPSLIGVIPYAATNYYAYDTLRKAYKRFLKCEEIGNVATLLIGSAAGAISSSTTFPLEVARKHMQAGALNGRQYKNMLHALVSILEHEGVGGLYRGLGPSCLKLVPAAGISFMVYEACKHILVEDENGNAMQT